MKPIAFVIDRSSVRTILPLIFMILLFSAGLVCGQSGTSSKGRINFQGQTKIGRVLLPCSMQYDSSSNTYRITGSGTNMWFNEDDFYYVWRKASGNFQVVTDVDWVGKGKQPHRKAGWVVRASLDSDAPYADAVIHGDSLICLQYRLAKGDSTKEIQSPWKAPATLSFKRNGDKFTLTIIKEGKENPVGTVEVKLREEVYAGLAVCSHDSTTQETAIFSNVKFKQTGK